MQSSSMQSAATAAPPQSSLASSATSTSVASTISADERLLLCSLIETQQFGPAVKAIFDRQWIAKGEYQAILTDSVNQKQGQIKQICETHYADFLAGIDHLLSMKLDLAELRSLAKSLNLSVQMSGRSVLASARQLNEQRRLRYQINSAKQIVQSCASLIALARKAKQQIYNQKYFSALKTLNQLQRILHVASANFQQSSATAAAAAGANGATSPTLASPSSMKGGYNAAGSPSSTTSLSSTSSLSVKSGSTSGSNKSKNNPAGSQLSGDPNEIRYEFIRQLERQIPLLTGKIKESVKSEFTAWLNSITKRSHAIGELALAQLDDHLTAVDRKVLMKKKEAVSRTNKRRKDNNSSSKSSRRRKNEEDEDEENGENEDGVNGEGGDRDDAHEASQSTTSSANLFDLIPINFTPIYQCLHIYEHLNLAEQFQNLYKEKRNNQLMEVVHSLANLGSGASLGSGTGSNSNPGRKTSSAGPGSSPTAAVTIAGPSSPSSAGSMMTSFSKDQFIEAYSSVFASITGFFIIEDNILKSGNELISRAEIDTLYEKIQRILISYMSIHFSRERVFESPAYFLQVKYITILFCKIMSENFLGMNSQCLYSFLEEQRYQFEEILLTRFRGELKSILQKERWEPLGISSKSEYELFVLNFALQEESINVDFPCTMPFSISVPLLCRILCNFIEDYFQYSRYLQDSGPSSSSSIIGSSPHDMSSSSGGGGGANVGSGISSSWKGHIFRAVDRALIGEVNRTFHELLLQANLPISQTVQFSINAQVLSELTCGYLERFITTYSEDQDGEGAFSFQGDDLHSLASSPPSSPMSASAAAAAAAASGFILHAREELLSTKLRCEDLIFELISNKIDQFLELNSEFNWLPDGQQASPSDYILDLIAYLETTFYHMSFMPDAVREAVHFTSCKHIANTLLETMASQSSNAHCKKFNVIAIANLNQDLHVLEAFAQRCPIQNLVETFSEIRQLIDLLMSGEVEILLDPAAKSAHYPHLSSHKLIKILSKFKDISMFSLSTPAQFKKLKQKTVENVVKQLQLQLKKQ